MKITIKGTPKEILDVQPDILEIFKKRKNNQTKSNDQMQADYQDSVADEWGHAYIPIKEHERFPK